MKSFKYIHTLLLSLSCLAGLLGQTNKKTLNYQAVILDPKAINIPGASIVGQPLNKGNVCLRFSLLNAQGGLDYEETQQVTTDEYGLVSVNIGVGTQGSSTSIYKSFESIVWNSSMKSLKVSVSYDGCNSFKQVSSQALNYTPYALYSEAVDYKNVKDAPTRLSQFSNDAGYLIPKDLDPLKSDIQTNSSKIEVANKSIADNKQASDASFLIVKQSITSLDTQVAANTSAIKENTSTITNINTKLSDQQNQINDNRNQITATSNNLNTQIGGLQGQLNSTNSTMSNLAGTSEVISNKSTAVNLGGANPSDQLYPSQRATKTYVDQNISNLVAGNIPDATTLASGKIQLAGDLAGTATNPTVPALADKENISNKSTNVQTDATSDMKYPSVKAVKDYVDQATLGTALAVDLANKANIASPAFTGTPTAPTQASGDNSTKLATTAFVQAATAGIALQAVVDAKADKESPTFTGTPSLPTGTTGVTQSVGDNSTKLATTAFVQAAASAGTVDADASTKGKVQLAGDLAGTATAPTITNSAVINKTLTGYTAAPGAITSSDNILSAIQKLDGNKAPLESPNLTGTPTAPTPTVGDNSQQIATTAFVTSMAAAGTPTATTTTLGKIQLAGDLDGTATAPTITNSAVINKTLTGYTAAPGAITSSDNILSAIQKLDGNKAPLESPNLTGTPTAPTPTVGDNSQQIATTAFVTSMAAAGTPTATTTTLGKVQLAGDLAGTATAPTITNSAVINKTLTGYTAAPGAITSSDNILSAIQKLDGNKAPLESPNLTGTPTAPTATAGDNSSQIATTAFVTSMAAAGTPTATTTTLGKIQLAGDLDGTATAPTITNSAVINKTLTGYTATTGAITSSDNILSAIQKLDGNKAPLESPNLTGTPTAPTATAGDNSSQIATTAFVTSSVSSGTPTATTTTLGKIQLAGDLDGTATAPTITNSAVINKTLTGYTATTGAITSSDNILSAIQKLDGNKAPLESPNLTGTPTAPTATAGDNSSQIATTAFVTSSVSSGTPTATTSTLGKIQLAGDLDGTATAPTITNSAVINKTLTGYTATTGAITSSDNILSAIQKLDGNKAPLESPNLTGTPTAPTATAGDNSSQIATTAFVTSSVSSGTPTATTSTLGKIQLAGDLDGTATAPTITNSAVINKTLTGYTATTGAITSSDNILSAIQKLDGNKAPLESPTFTGTPEAPTASLGTSNTQIATTEFVTRAVAGTLSGTVAVANGGTGATTLSGLLKGNGTSAITSAIAGTDYQAPITLTTTGTGAATISGTTLNIPVVNAGTVSGTVNFLPKFTSSTTIGNSSITESGTDVTILSNGGRLGVGGSDLRGVLTVNALNNTAYSVNGDPGDGGRPFINQNISALNTAGLFSGITLQVSPTLGVGSGGRVLGDIRLVRSGTTSASNFVFSAFNATGAYRDYFSTGDAGTIVSGNFSAGGITATSVNKLAITSPTNGSTLTIADGKTLTVNNSLTFAGTDDRTMTFPSTNATIARTDAPQTFTGKQTFDATGIALSGSTSGTSTLVANAVAGTTTLTLPAVDGTLATIAANVNSISTNYNLTSSDNGKIINVTSSSAITITIPSGLPLGFNCMVVQNGAGQVTFSGSGATVNNRTSRTKTAGQYAIVTIICLTTNVFITSGDMSN